MTERQCYFCTNNLKEIDSKNAELLRRYLDAHAKILPKKQTGVCAKHQRKLAKAIKSARILALLPFVGE